MAASFTEDVDGVGNREDAREDEIGVDVTTSNGVEGELLFASVRDSDVD